VPAVRREKPLDRRVRSDPRVVEGTRQEPNAVRPRAGIEVKEL
jgi:hypothetical protein